MFEEPSLVLWNIVKTDPAATPGFDGEEPIKVKTNYNLLDQTFDIEGEDNILKLEPNKVLKVTFSDRVFVSKNGKFYESIEENSNFSLLSMTVYRRW